VRIPSEAQSGLAVVTLSYPNHPGRVKPAVIEFKVP
jgi:hypothetical protein